MRLLLYSHYFAPSIGGVETIVMSLARGLAELHTPDGAPEFEVTLVTQTAQEDFDDSVLSFRVVRRPEFWKLLRLTRKADIVHIAGPGFLPMMLAWLTRKPYVVEHHNYQAICPNGLLIHLPDRAVCPGHFQAGAYGECWKCEAAENTHFRTFVKLMSAFPRRALVRQAACNIAVSEHVKRRIHFSGTNVVHHGLAGITGMTDSSAMPFSQRKKIRFAYVGRFVPDKGVQVLVQALAKLAADRVECEALLIGDGPERSRIEAEIDANKLGSTVKITGFLPKAELEATLAGTHVIVLAALGEETAGLAVIEQMQRGRLAIVSDIGGLPETIGDAGLLFPPGDANALAARMKEVIATPAMIDSLGARAQRRVVEQFSRTRMIDEHAAIYRRVVQTHVER